MPPLLIFNSRFICYMPRRIGTIGRMAMKSSGKRTTLGDLVTSPLPLGSMLVSLLIVGIALRAHWQWLWCVGAYLCIGAALAYYASGWRRRFRLKSAPLVLAWGPASLFAIAVIVFGYYKPRDGTPRWELLITLRIRD